MDKATLPGIESPALPFSSCMTLSKLLDLSLPQFPHLKNESANNSTYHKRSLWGNNKFKM